MRIPLGTIGGDDTTRELKTLVFREYDKHGGNPSEYSSWGGGFVHQPATFGDVTLMR